MSSLSFTFSPRVFISRSCWWFFVSSRWISILRLESFSFYCSFKFLFISNSSFIMLVLVFNSWSSSSLSCLNYFGISSLIVIFSDWSDEIFEFKLTIILVLFFSFSVRYSMVVFFSINSFLIMNTESFSKFMIAGLSWFDSIGSLSV